MQTFCPVEKCGRPAILKRPCKNNLTTGDGTKFHPADISPVFLPAVGHRSQYPDIPNDNPCVVFSARVNERIFTSPRLNKLSRSSVTADAVLNNRKCISSAASDKEKKRNKGSKCRHGI
jgi:hypothetical protein